MQVVNQKNQYFSQFITKERFKKMCDILESRTNKISIVLEDIYQSHNASAVVRTCECFGIQQLHLIENKNRYQVNPEIVLGANQWVTMHRYSNPSMKNTETCYEKLRKDGYRIIATSPHQKGVQLEQLSLDGKLALVFGTERDGLSPYAIESADEYTQIPMHGFTESLNISVTVAIIIHFLSLKMRQECSDWRLTDEEKNLILHSWFEKSLKNFKQINESFYNNNGVV